jgi:hypothetical protein
MEEFEMYWITNRHHNSMKFLRRMQRDRLRLLASRSFKFFAEITIVMGVLRWLAELGV